MRRWLKILAETHYVKIDELNYIFVSDDTLLQINLDFLHHNTYTDIITFNNSESKEIEGDIFISLDRVADNAGKFKVTQEQELVRVMSHGLLHLVGFNDKTASEKKKIRAAEEQSIKLFKVLKK